MENNLNILEHPHNELLFGQLNAAVLLLDAKGEVAYLNPSAERLLAISFNLAKGKGMKQLFRQEQGLGSAIQEVLQSGRTMKLHEMEVFSLQGPLKLQIEMAPIGMPENPTGVLLWMQELTIIQALQEENRVLDRLSMMGTLASGLAHEIRNPLGGIRAAAEMLMREASKKEKNEYSEIIISEVDRLNQLITQLLDFAKPKKLKKTSINVNQVLSEVLILQGGTMKKQGILLKQEFDPSLPPVAGHEGSLKQAFLNLIKNAVEAMPKGGLLRIVTSYMSDYHMHVGEGRGGAMAQVLISDTGGGISEKNLNSLFTPFFTTKPQGTGLGLMMTQRILKEHEGLLKVQSQLGKGTAFRVLLKLAN
jgi:two-component system, NtrC family, nitrogen regulation sensor histidine kinase GlnL